MSSSFVDNYLVLVYVKRVAIFKVHALIPV